MATPKTFQGGLQIKVDPNPATAAANSVNQINTTLAVKNRNGVIPPLLCPQIIALKAQPIHVPPITAEYVFTSVAFLNKTPGEI